MGPRFEVSSERLKKPLIEPTDKGVTSRRFLLNNLRVYQQPVINIIGASYRYNFVKSSTPRSIAIQCSTGSSIVHARI